MMLEANKTDRDGVVTYNDFMAILNQNDVTNDANKQLYGTHQIWFAIQNELWVPWF